MIIELNLVIKDNNGQFQILNQQKGGSGDPGNTGGAKADGTAGLNTEPVAEQEGGSGDPVHPGKPKAEGTAGLGKGDRAHVGRNQAGTDN